MNKKFSTLVASLLLAGGLFSTANAESYADVVDVNNTTSGWYYVYVNAEGAATTQNGMLTLKSTGNLWEMDKADADVWRVVAVLNDGKTAITGYKLQNQDGDYLEVKVPTTDGGTTTYNTFMVPSGTTQYLSFSNNAGFKGQLDAVVTANSWQYDLVAADPQTLTVGDLNYYEKDGFSVTIKGQDETTKKYTVALNGNPFAGHLTPMTWNGTNFVVAANTETSFYLKNAAGEYIVATEYDGEGASASQALYGFSTIDSTTLKRDLINSGAKYSGLFSAEAYINEYKKDSKDLSRLQSLYVKNIELGRYDFTSVPTLVAFETTELKSIQIALGSDLVVNPKDLLVKGKFYTVKKTVGTTVTYLGLNNYGWAAWVTDYSNVLEGQWALTTSNSNGTGNYVFTNRENLSATNTEIAIASLYKTDKANVYAQGGATYEIVPVAEHADTDGYMRLNVTETSKFNIGFSSSVFGSIAWMTENHAGASNHTIGLDIDKEDALSFTATEYSAARKAVYNKNNQLVKTPTDSIYVISKLGYYNATSKKFETTPDTLKIVSYSFVNQYGEPLVYNSKVAAYQAWTEKDEDGILTESAQKFALRLDGEKLNLRKLDVVWNTTDYTKGQNLYDTTERGFYTPYKMYAGDAANGILANVELYDRTENDLFVIEETEKPVYRRLVNAIDTVSIYRDENSSQLLYEEGALLTTENEAGETEVLAGFLGLQNANQFEIAPAMLADAAYAPETTHKPLYMLAVGTTVVPAGKYCPVHGADADCKDEHMEEVAGWVEGRYLVCLQDSAKAWAEANPTKHATANPYQYEGMNKLGFVSAIHRNDSIIIASDNEQYYLGAGKMNPATFAFRYVDEEAGSFVVETHCGYIKWINGNVVVTDKINDADVFNMNEEETSAPTANETIAASAVTVIAGEGNVTIAGAAGKKVVIANILGQTIANTVLTSDNATIAAPAGVVVVAVEGEAAVKAIVK